MSLATDKLAIQEVKHDYCYVTDDLDVERIPDVFSADTYLKTPLYEAVEGHDGVREYFEYFGEQEFEVRAHNVVNPVIDVDGDTATGRWYYMVVYALPGGDLLFGHGDYEDEFVRTDDGWRVSYCVAKRRITRRVSAEEMN